MKIKIVMNAGKKTKRVAKKYYPDTINGKKPKSTANQLTH